MSKYLPQVNYMTDGTKGLIKDGGVAHCKSPSSREKYI
jgi:hypothetical protein